MDQRTIRASEIGGQRVRAGSGPGVCGDYGQVCPICQGLADNGDTGGLEVECVRQSAQRLVKGGVEVRRQCEGRDVVEEQLPLDGGLGALTLETFLFHGEDMTIPMPITRATYTISSH